MLNVIEENAKVAEAERLETAKALREAKAEAAEADDMLAVAETAKAEIEAEEKIRRDREKLAASVDVCKRNAKVRADALRAAEKADGDAIKAKGEAEAEAKQARTDYRNADYVIAAVIDKMLTDCERMSDAAMIEKLPDAIEAARDGQLDARLGGRGGGVPLTFYDRLAGETDHWLSILRSDGELVSLFFRDGDHWQSRPIAKDMIYNAAPKISGPDAQKAQAVAYLRSRPGSEDFEPLPDEPDKKEPIDGPIIEDGPLQGRRRYTALT